MIKSIIAVFFLITAIIAAFSMFTLMGKIEKKTDPAILRKLHKIAGWSFGLVLLVLAYLKTI